MLINRNTNELNFITSAKYKKDEAFLRYLFFAMISTEEEAGKNLDYFIGCSIKGKQDYHDIDKYTEKTNINKLIYKLLRSVILDNIDKNDGIPKTLGVSSGYDSRALLLVLKEDRLPAVTYTFGQIGNLDFDYSKLLFKRLKTNNLFFDTSDITWELSKYEQNVVNFRDYPISCIFRHIRTATPEASGQ